MQEEHKNYLILESTERWRISLASASTEAFEVFRDFRGQPIQ